MDSTIFIPGVKQEDLTRIFKEFKIKDISELTKLAKSKKIRKLKGFNSKTEMAILRGIKLIENQPDYLPIGIALDFSNILITELKAWPHISQVLLVGDLRRGVEKIKSIDILLKGNYVELKDGLQKILLLDNEVSSSNKKTIYNSKLGIPVIFHFSSSREWGTDCILTTGSGQHLASLAKIVNTLPKFETEEEVYKNLNLPWIPPEIRETGYETEFAREGILPELIDIKEIKGDLHIHSRWSDGSNTIEEIILNGIKLGYEYVAITDHSQALKMAGGLRPEDLMRQIEEINKLQLKYPQIRILKGIEVDILKDGTLDFTDDILNKLDIVIASIHSHFEMSKGDMTKRIIKALKHPLVKIIAHPTGRILGKRPGYKVDINEVINAAAQTNKVLEVNASPDRLDIRDIHLQIAKTRGVKIAINTDAHHIQSMEDMIFGVQTAKRGWQGKENIINTWSYDKLINYLSSI
jgi:DNA polymerase (family 10)